MLDALHADLRLRLERCEGAPARVLSVVNADSSVAQAKEVVGKALGEHRHACLGVLGMTSYRFAPQLYKNAGPKAAQLICEAAAQASSAGGWSHVLMGGSWGGPQRTFAEAFEETATTVVHVLPNTGEAIVDLIYLLFADAMNETEPRATTAQFVFVGSSYRVRNCVLASLCAQVFIVGGGPGTHLEVMAARGAGVGLLPLVRSGGLAEGVDFNGRNLHGLVEALADTPPPEVSLASWQVLLGLPTPQTTKNNSSGNCGCCRKRREVVGKTTRGEGPHQRKQPTLEEYIESLRRGLSQLRPSLGEVPNRWAFNREEQEQWIEQLDRLQRPTDWELMH